MLTEGDNLSSAPQSNSTISGEEKHSFLPIYTKKYVFVMSRRRNHYIFLLNSKLAQLENCCNQILSVEFKWKKAKAQW